MNQFKSRMDDVLWNLEDKIKLSTEESIAVLACIALLFLGLCTAAAATVIIKKWRNKRKISLLIHQEPPTITACMSDHESDDEDDDEAEVVIMKMKKKRRRRICMEAPEQQQCGGGGVKKVLMRSVRWSGVNYNNNNKKKKWEERPRTPPPLLMSSRRFEGWQSNNSTSPVWQRPILMGEKCELPRFSGLILYDERGRPVVHHNSLHPTLNYQEEPAETAIVGTTLRDLLH